MEQRQQTMTVTASAVERLGFITIIVLGEVIVAVIAAAARRGPSRPPRPVFSRPLP